MFACTQKTAKISRKRPKSRENAYNSGHCAGILDLYLMSKAIPAYSAWPESTARPNWRAGTPRCTATPRLR
jgi:hypothetical protein